MAGTAPAPTIAAVMRRSASRLAGIGRPWARTELSRATTGRPPARAAATAGGSRTGPGSREGTATIARLRSGTGQRKAGQTGARVGQALENLTGDPRFECPVIA